jgi:ABC-2 type transport system ATP-binding protein
MALIEVSELRRQFRVRQRTGRIRRSTRSVPAVDGITFTVDSGEVVGYIGPNGAGKSTTIKMLTGILVPTSGEVRVGGLVPARDRTTLARRMGVVFGQRTALWWDLPLRDSFELLRRIHRIDDERYRHNVGEFSEALGLREFIETPVRQLSLGQRMRGDIAAALLHDPDIVYLDEPTIGLDVVSKAALRSFLQRVHAERDITVLLTTHDLTDIEHLSSRVMVIDHGRLVYDGGLDGLRRVGGASRTLVVDLVEPGDPIRIAGATTTKVDGPRQWLAFPAEASAAPLVTALAREYAIADLSILEPRIEDVISRIYAEGMP